MPVKKRKATRDGYFAFRTPVGNYRVDLPAKLFPDGKRHSVTAKTEEDAIRKADEVIGRSHQGLKQEAGNMTLAEFLKIWLDFYESENGVERSTWGDYRYHVEYNINPVIGAVTLIEAA